MSYMPDTTVVKAITFHGYPTEDFEEFLKQHNSIHKRRIEQEQGPDDQNLARVFLLRSALEGEALKLFLGLKPQQRGNYDTLCDLLRSRYPSGDGDTYEWEVENKRDNLKQAPGQTLAEYLSKAGRGTATAGGETDATYTIAAISARADGGEKSL
jgi:hypothetical protein